MKKEGERSYRAALGAPSMLLIITVLCLTTLGVLSFSTSRADLAAARRAAIMAEGYYQAAAVAEEKLAALGSGAEALSELEREENEYLFSVDAGEGRTLNVRFVLSGSRPAVTAFYLTGAGDFAEDATLNLYTGGDEVGID